MVKDYLRSAKQVFLFFNAYQDPMNTIVGEAYAVAAFLAAVCSRC